MFDICCYRIVETKEEFLKDWDKWRWEYDGSDMEWPSFNPETATFPLPLLRYRGFGPITGWTVRPFEEVKTTILQAYREYDEEYYAEKIKRLENLRG